jgi:hypothetical protein
MNGARRDKEKCWVQLILLLVLVSMHDGKLVTTYRQGEGQTEWKAGTHEQMKQPEVFLGRTTGCRKHHNFNWDFI